MDQGSLKKFVISERKTRKMINLDPLQTGGILTEEARQVLVEWGDGFSVCDFCSGRLEDIKNPPIFDFVHIALPEFVGADAVTITNGAREGFFLVMHALAKPGDFVIVDKNTHYSTYVAAERAGLRVKEVPNSGHPEYAIDVENYRQAIDEAQKEGKVALLFLTWPDGNYGNFADARRLAQIAAEYKIPFLLNAVYAIGRMPVNMSEIGADFIVASGHKSMASSGPIGFVGTKKEWEPVLRKKSQFFPKKDVEQLGCTARGASIMTMMASFPKVVARTNDWPEQVEKAQWFSQEMEKLGLFQLGQKPHQHDLMFFESQNLYEISQKSKKGAFFLYEELKKNNIWGIKPGLTKKFKISVFAASKEELQKVLDVFAGILKK